MEFLTEDDLTSFAVIDSDKAEQMIADATALAMLAAPCLATEPTTLTANQQAGVKAVLRAAILRWNDAGNGALTNETVGGISTSYDNRQPRKGMFWPSEIQQLQSICADTSAGGAFNIDTVSATTVHSDICALNFGALYCSCAADIAGFPLYEYGY